jgi:hypothetical protein
MIVLPLRACPRDLIKSSEMEFTGGLLSVSVDTPFVKSVLTVTTSLEEVYEID